MSFKCLNVSSYKPDSVWSWFICFCCTMYMMLTLGFSFALGVLFPVFMDSFNESRERTGKLKNIYLNLTTLSSGKRRTAVAERLPNRIAHCFHVIIIQFYRCCQRSPNRLNIILLFMPLPVILGCISCSKIYLVLRFQETNFIATF